MRGKVLLAVLLWSVTAQADQGDYARLPGGAFQSALRFDDSGGATQLAPYLLMRRPVTEGEFFSFLEAHPQWRRGQIPAVFADSGYLSHWSEASGPRPGTRDYPVVRVSWFAADAYCRARRARLPAWLEWEFAAAADGQRKDARGDPAWRTGVLMEGIPGSRRDAGSGVENVYGVHDLHGLVWEWPWDHGALLAADDSRGSATGDRLRYCGGSALAFSDRNNYAVIKRVALLAALDARTTLPNLGFRCAKEQP